MECPDFSVCTIARNPIRIANFLNSLQSAAQQVSIEIIIMEGVPGIFDDSMIREFSEVTVLKTPGNRPGDAGALNLAAHKACGRYIAFLDQDVAVQPDSLRIMVDFLDSAPDTGIAGPLHLDPQGIRLPSAFSFPGSFSLLGLMLGFLNPCTLHNNLFEPTGSPVKSDWLLGDCFFIRKDAMDEIGFLDDRFCGYYCFVDYCLRASKAGWHIHFVPRAIAIHHNFPDMKASFSGTLRYMKKNWFF
ncbi:MAG: glycosyltransferase family 2 protein [Proteobacteria bacterium]|nr:glycosyltransferase family 2 protein [Pseudomonadota bacterium]